MSTNWAWKKEHWYEDAKKSRRESYHKNKAPLKVKIKKTKEEKRINYNKSAREGKRRKREILERHKVLNGCKDCGEQHPATLTYHHRDKAQKSFDISRAVDKRTLAILMLEVAKCDVLCFNCHAKIHWQERKLAAKNF